MVRFGASSSQDNPPLAGFSNSQLVERAVVDQPLHYRKALLLCEVEEMPYQEIAEILAIPTENVMSRLPRVRKYVRESLLSAPDYVAWTLANSHSFGTD
jgi:DNA-directed RNA polymerase specialized sigma24 family protein